MCGALPQGVEMSRDPEEFERHLAELLCALSRLLADYQEMPVSERRALLGRTKKRKSGNNTLDRANLVLLRGAKNRLDEE